MFNSSLTKFDFNFNSVDRQGPKTGLPSMFCFQDLRINFINNFLNFLPTPLKKAAPVDCGSLASIGSPMDPILTLIRNQFINQFKHQLSAGFISPRVMLIDETADEKISNEILPTSSVCALCGRIFRFEKNLQRHLERNHSAVERESLLKCKMCHYTTKHYSNMYVHIRTHTGDKPYYCAACGASFTQGSSLKLHIKSRHHDNMKFFALSKKPRKSNLTKLWSRVYKSDLGQISPVHVLQSYRQSSGSLLISPNIWSKADPTTIIDKQNSKNLFNLFSPLDSTPMVSEKYLTDNDKNAVDKKIPYSVQFMIE